MAPPLPGNCAKAALNAAVQSGPPVTAPKSSTLTTSSARRARSRATAVEEASTVPKLTSLATGEVSCPLVFNAANPPLGILAPSVAILALAAVIPWDKVVSSLVTPGSVLAAITPVVPIETLVPALNSARKAGIGKRVGVPLELTMTSSPDANTLSCTKAAWSPPLAFSAALCTTRPRPTPSASGPPGPSEARPRTLGLGTSMAACVPLSNCATDTARVMPDWLIGTSSCTLVVVAVGNCAMVGMLFLPPHNPFGGSGLARCCRKRKVFFFEKKNQKTFAHWRVLPASRAPRVKSFLLLFFQKRRPSFSSA